MTTLIRPACLVVLSLCALTATAPAQGSASGHGNSCPNVPTARGPAKKVSVKGVSCRKAEPIIKEVATTGQSSGWKVKFQYVPSQGDHCVGRAYYKLTKSNDVIRFYVPVTDRLVRC